MENPLYVNVLVDHKQIYVIEGETRRISEVNIILFLCDEPHAGT